MISKYQSALKGKKKINPCTMTLKKPGNYSKILKGGGGFDSIPRNNLTTETFWVVTAGSRRVLLLSNGSKGPRDVANHPTVCKTVSTTMKIQPQRSRVPQLTVLGLKIPCWSCLYSVSRQHVSLVHYEHSQGTPPPNLKVKPQGFPLFSLVLVTAWPSLLITRAVPPKKTHPIE